MAGYIGSAASVVSSGAERKKTFTITGATTSLTGLNYTVGKVHVFQNGVRLVDGTDYTATNGTTITLTVAAQSGDNVVVISQASFQVADALLTSGGTMTGDLSLGDNNKAIFGAGSDLQVSHDGSNSYIKDVGTGNLTISANQVVVKNAASNEAGILFTENSAVELYHDDSKKLETTSTGVDVTGTVTSDGLTVSTSASGFASQITNNNDSSQGLQVRTSDNDGGQFILDLQSSGSATGTDYASKFVVTKNGNATLNPNSLGATYLNLNTGASDDGHIIIQRNGSNKYQITSGTTNALQFYNYSAGGESMRIHQNGRVSINSSTDNIHGVSGMLKVNATSSASAAATFYRPTTSWQYSITFHNDNGLVGSINTNGSSTSFNTSSDYRLKTDVQPMTGASARVQALNPVNFEWVTDGSRVDGFLAHEAQTVVPEAIHGTKDAMRDEEYEVTPAVEATYDDDGNELTAATEAVMGTRSVPDYQGIDQSKLVPLLTAALQEALTEIASLKTRVEALEA